MLCRFESRLLQMRLKSNLVLTSTGLIFTKISSKCHGHWLDRMPCTRRFRISDANIGPNRFHQYCTVS